MSGLNSVISYAPEPTMVSPTMYSSASSADGGSSWLPRGSSGAVYTSESLGTMVATV